MWCALPALARHRRCGSRSRTRSSCGSSPTTCRRACATCPTNELSLVLNDVRNLVAGNVPADVGQRSGRAAASAEYLQLRGISRMALTVLVLVHRPSARSDRCARASRRELRARNRVERVIEWLLIGCSTIAVFTTIGIVASVAFEAFRFFAISRRSISCSACVEPADGDPRRPGGLFRRVRRRAAVRRHGADLRHRHAHRRAHRAVLGDLPRRVRASAVPHLGQAVARSARGRARPWSTASSRR